MYICHLRSESQGGRFYIQYTQYVYAIILLHTVKLCKSMQFNKYGQPLYSLVHSAASCEDSATEKKCDLISSLKRRGAVENVWKESARVLCPCDAECVQVIWMFCDTMHFTRCTVLLLKCSVRARDSSRNTCSLRLRHHTSACRAAKQQHYKETIQHVKAPENPLFTLVLSPCSEQSTGGILYCAPWRHQSAKSSATWVCTITVHCPSKKNNTVESFKRRFSLFSTNLSFRS